MKHFIGTFILLTIVSLNLSAQNSKYDMLTDAESLIKKRQFKQASELAIKIQAKARAKKQDVLFVKAVEIELQANQWFQYETFEMALQAFDTHISNGFGRTPLLFHIQKIQAIDAYYQQNKYKLKNNIDDGMLNNEPMQWSEHDVLQLVHNEIQALSKLETKTKLTEEEFVLFSEGISVDGVKPTSIFDLGLLTAIKVVEKIKGDYLFISDKLYVSVNEFVDEFNSMKIKHPIAYIAHYYSLLLDNQVEKNSDLALHFNLMRLNAMYEEDKQFQKLENYKQALIQIVKKESPIMALASYHLAQLYSGYATRFYNDEDNKKIGVKWQNKALETCNTAIKKYPKSYGANCCRNFISIIKTQAFNIHLQAYVIPDRKIPIRISFKNQKWAHISAYKITSQTFMKAQTRDEFLDPKKLEKVWQQKINFPQYKDFFTHDFVTTLPALEKGFYYLHIETEKPNKLGHDSNHKIIINSTNLATISEPKENQTHFKLLNRTFGHTVPNCQVAIYDRNYDYRGRKHTIKLANKLESKNGQILINKKLNNDFLSVMLDNDTLVELFGANYYRERNFRSRKQVNIYTDRSIYRPGQVVYFKGIVFNSKGNEYKPLPNENIEVSILSTNHKTLKKIKLSSNDYGSFEGKYTIPEQSRAGIMQIRTPYGSQSIDIQIYKRPTFDITFKPSDKISHPGDNVQVELECESFSGVFIENAKVVTTIKLQSTFFRYWFPNISEMVVAHFSTQTDNKGIAKLNFQSLQSNSNQTYLIETTVTLPDGASRDFTYHYTVSSNPIRISLGLSDSFLDATQTPEISLTGINGEVVNETVKMHVHQIKMPDDYFFAMPFSIADTITYSEDNWQRNFPGMAWNNALEPENQIIEKKVFSHSDKGYQLSYPKEQNLAEGWYRFEFFIADTLYTTKYLKVVDKKERKCKFASPLIMMADKEQVKPEENLTLYFSSKFKNAHVFVMISDKEGMLLEKKLEIKGRKESITVPIQTRSEGSINIEVILIREGQQFHISRTIQVEPLSSKIDVSVESLRNVLLPGNKEIWTVKLTQNGTPVAHTEVLASMYDMSLDEFKPHQWVKPSQLSHYFNLRYQNRSFSNTYFRINYYSDREPEKPFNWILSNPFSNRYDYSQYSTMHKRLRETGSASLDQERVEPLSIKQSGEEEEVEEDNQLEINEDAYDQPESEKSVQVRTNFNETAFFYPMLNTNTEGKTNIKFTVPETMSKWKLQILAHNKEMDVGYANYEIVTQKPLMIIPNKLRFVHRNDEVEIQAIAYNLTDSAIRVVPSAKITNSVSGKELIFAISDKKLNLQPKGNQSFTIKFTVPDNFNALTYQITAQSGQFSDGEIHTIPVLPSRQQIVNTMAIWNKPGQKKTYQFTSLNTLESQTADNHKLTFELTTNPIWYAIKAIPAVYETQSKSAIQLSRNFRVSAIANDIIQNYPEIQHVFNVWSKAQPEALKSSLRKNKAMRNLLLGETPWEQIADNEELQRGMLMEMLNPNFVDQNLKSAINQLENQQQGDGAFSWQPGMQPSFYFTLRTAYNLSQTLDLNKIKETDAEQIVKKSVNYLRTQVEKRYSDLLRYSTDTSKYVTSTDIMMYFLVQKSINKRYKPQSNAELFFFNHSQHYKKMGLYALTMSGKVALAFSDQSYANLVINRLRERAVVHKEEGIYWKNNSLGWTWDEAPIEIHAMIIDFFHQMKQPEKEIELMKMWLIRQKQGQAWNNANASLNAVQALVNTGMNWLNIEKPVKITMGNLVISSDEEPQEAGTGYFQKELTNLSTKMKEINVDNPSKVPIWGAVYHVFNDDFNKVEAWEDQMSIERSMYIVKSTKTGEKMELFDPAKTSLKVGDRIRTQLKIKSKCELDYVWVKSPHAACLEPVNQLSKYEWKGGLFYYTESRDTERRFFINRLKNGTFIIQYDLFVERNGKYKARPVEIQSAYAPEFGGHTTGYEIEVK